MNNDNKCYSQKEIDAYMLAQTKEIADLKAENERLKAENAEVAKWMDAAEEAETAYYKGVEVGIETGKGLAMAECERKIKLLTEVAKAVNLSGVYKASKEICHALINAKKGGALTD